MANITKTTIQGTGAKSVNLTTLGASDTLTYTKGVNATLLLINNSGGALTPNIDGDESTTIPVQGYGTVDVSAGYDVPSIADGDATAIELETIEAYLKGTITVTGGSGITAALLEY